MTIAKPLPVQDIYTSSALNPASLSIYHLGILLDNDHFLYSISTAQNEPLFVRLYKNREGLEISRFLDAVWHQDDFLRKRFAHVLFLMDVEKWMVVPSEYTPDGKEMEFLRAYYEIRAGGDGEVVYRAHKEILRGSGAAFLALLPVSLYEYLQARSGTLEAHHLSYRYVQLSRHLIQTHLQHRPYIGIVWLFLGTFYYCFFAGEQLLFVNRFSAATTEDVLYYIQGLHNLLGIDKGQVGIAVAGYSTLKPYVMTVMYRFFGTGYKDLGKLFSTPSTLKEVGLATEDLLFLTMFGADN
ncbi:MAG: DUF3822 family protein [Bacteroidia bacterium]|nr:DUF3822 family protein [Bacteroidia bacterium]MDW8014558.1 DUF3822 family protein [Bacteroidia bacterium]